MLEAFSTQMERIKGILLGKNESTHFKIKCTNKLVFILVKNMK